MRYLAFHTTLLLGTLLGALAFSSLARAETPFAWPAEISASIEVADCALLETSWDARYNSTYRLGHLLDGEARKECHAIDREFFGTVGQWFPYSCEQGVMSARFTVGCAWVF